jgi:hypothetical protein
MIRANHPFRQRSLNVLDERGREGCATCARPRDVHPEPVGAELLALARKRLAVLVDEPDTTLDALLARLFDRDHRELLTYSAFGSAL